MLKLINELTTLELVIWCTFAGLLAIQIVYYLIIYRKLLFKKNAATENPKNLPPVSVIICAKNEAYNLQQYLPLVLKQDYPNYEVIVINDCSEDDSLDILEDFSKEYPHLYFSNLKKDPIYTHGKKVPIMLGIKAAKNEHLVFIDADCYPTSDKWLQLMAHNFDNEKKIVLGISIYEKSKGLLGNVISYESMQTAISYISSAMRSAAYMGVGRNMAYTKNLFYENNGFSGHTHILSGYDNLFVNKAATKNNVAVEISAEAIVKTFPKATWSTYFKQKYRKFATYKLYKKRDKTRFVFESLLGFMFSLTFILLLSLAIYPLIALGAYLFKYLVVGGYRAISAHKLHFDKTYILQGLWLEIIVPVIHITVYVLNLFKPKRKNTWR